MYVNFRRHKVNASWKPDKASSAVNRGSHFQVHFVWQVWDGQSSPAFKSIRLKAFGGWKFDRSTTKLHARILWGKGAQKKMKPNMFTVKRSTSTTFVLPVRHSTGVALQTKSTEVSQNPQSNRVANETPKNTDMLCGVWWPSWSTCSKQQQTCPFPLNRLFLPFRRNKVYASWKPDKASISVNRGSHFQVHFVWQVWDGQFSPAFESVRLKAFGGWKFDRSTTKLHARILWGKGAQKKMKPNMFTVRSSTSTTFVLPVYTCICMCIYIYMCVCCTLHYVTCISRFYLTYWC